MGDQNNPDLPVSKPEPGYELYKIFRSYVEHEDDLINQRLNWNLSIQGFLFGAYVFAFQKIGELWNDLSHTNENIDFVPIKHALGQLYAFLVVVALVGTCVSLFVLLSVYAATLALRELKSRWAAVSGAPVELPGLLGGGNALASSEHLSFQAPRILPLVFVVAWIVLTCIVARDFWELRIY